LLVKPEEILPKKRLHALNNPEMLKSERRVQFKAYLNAMLEYINQYPRYDAMRIMSDFLGKDVRDVFEPNELLYFWDATEEEKHVEDCIIEVTDKETHEKHMAERRIWNDDFEFEKRALDLVSHLDCVWTVREWFPHLHPGIKRVRPHAWIIRERNNGTVITLGEYLRIKQENGGVSDAFLGEIFKNLFNHIDEIHRAGVAHLDLGFNSIFVELGDQDHFEEIKMDDEKHADVVPKLRVWNFGKGKPLNDEELRSNVKYSCPDIQDNHTAAEYESADLWALGVMMYSASTGALPRDANCSQEVLAALRDGELGLERDALVSVYFRDLIQNILVKDPLKRPKISQVLTHPWVTGQMDFSEEIKEYVNFDIFKAVAFANQDSDLKRSVSIALAMMMDTEKLEDMRMAFSSLDTDRDGGITAQDLYENFLVLGFNEEDSATFSQTIVREFDKNDDGKISFEDYCNLVYRAKLSIDPQFVQDTFNEITQGNSNAISAQVLKDYLQDNDGIVESRLMSKSIGKAIKRVDIDRDGRLTFEEYAHAMKNWNPTRKSFNDRARDSDAEDMNDLNP
jgi:Ca2+-binding EF-hand superfamily protein